MLPAMASGLGFYCGCVFDYFCVLRGEEDGGLGTDVEGWMVELLEGAGC